LMGAADTVPGVSGGTMALMTGIYPKLITTISSFDKQFFSFLFSGKFKKALEHIDLKFLFTLLAGIGTGIICLAGIITSMIDNQPARIFALFFGMVLGSLVCIARGIKWNAGGIISFIAGTAIGYILITIIPFETPHTLGIIFLSGAVAITAMILPGISGAFILLILGKYDFILNAVKAPFESSMNTPNLLILPIFGAGCICGIMCSSKAINFMLKKFPNVTMSLMLGLMAGSVWRLWPWQEEFRKLSLPPETLLPVLLIILGIVVVFAIEFFAKLSEKKQLGNKKSDTIEPKAPEPIAE
ncbi:MAG: DUF368 domain-containing protein, partial [Fibrobacter sp.]|nr:DUF368 domain-containing protein [Fibrobacter sp.]